jgi:hypothetical protein
VTSLLPHQEIHEPNTSAVFDVWLVLRRQPWHQWARKALDLMKSMLQSALLAALLAALLLPAAAQARSYETLTVDVPFKFYVGDHTFRPGKYEVILAGPGLVALRDSKAHNVASLVTRSVETDGPASESKVVFKTQKKHAQLARIYVGSQVLEVLGEELAIRTPAPGPPSIMLVPDNFSFSQKQDGFRLRQ